MATDFDPTDEQAHAVDLASTGRSMAIEALAGAGKTSTLRLIAEAMRQKTLQYVAFNRKIVDDSKGSFPRNVRCSTAHGLAFQAVGKEYKQRLNDSRRLSARQLAQALKLDLDTPVIVDLGEETKEIWPTALATAAVATVGRFCQTADPSLGYRHVYRMPGIDAPGEWENHDKLAPRILTLAETIWRDLQDPRDGLFRFEHGHYLKMWSQRDPYIDADVIMFDEAQDASDVMRSVVEGQGHAQLIYVGDRQQAIYEWAGAVDALAQAKVDQRCQLTQSFRFGPEIAERANLVLDRLGAGVKVTGAGKPGTVGERVANPDCILGRTNGAVVASALGQMDDGKRVAIQGGTGQIEWFAGEAQKLVDGRRSDHPELACFDDWGQVLDYVEHDPGGRDLKVMVNLVDQYGGRKLKAMLADTIQPRNIHQADVVCSTAHKSKGGEWPSVRLLDDFPRGADVETAELRLMYVAASRAKTCLDDTLVDLAGKVPAAAGPVSKG
jgi:hypothetical protein